MNLNHQQPFHIHLGEPLPDDIPVTARTGVRAVIWDNNKLLMMKSNRGNYKFPGGGMEDGEDEQTALKRELLEETGYTDAIIEDLAVLCRHAF